MKDFKKKLRLLFEFQKFEQNKDLEKIIKKTIKKKKR